MIKNILIFIVRFYRDYVSISLRLLIGVSSSCRHEVTCSQYALNRIKDRGIFSLPGIFLRVITCQPYFRA